MHCLLRALCCAQALQSRKNHRLQAETFVAFPLTQVSRVATGSEQNYAGQHLHSGFNMNDACARQHASVDPLFHQTSTESSAPTSGTAPLVCNWTEGFGVHMSGPLTLLHCRGCFWTAWQLICRWLQASAAVFLCEHLGSQAQLD